MARSGFVRRDLGVDIAQSALSRWIKSQRQAQGMFASAEQPMQQSVQMFQPGGGYGKGQAMLLQEQARQAQAEALSNQVATGMSSGSLATGTGLRVKRDLAQGLAGVEDVRTQFLTQALQSLSGLRGQRAQTLSTVSDPNVAPTLSYLGGLQSAAVQKGISSKQVNAQLEIAKMRQRNQTQTQKQDIAPWASMRF